MPFRNEEFQAGLYFHVFNKSIEGVPLFVDDEDRLLFLGLLREASLEFGILMIAWCLMGNHFHLLLKQMGEDTISAFMQRACHRYACIANYRHNRKGHLFYRVFGARLVDSEEYMVRLCCYIHGNPVKAGLSRSVDSYRFSNYRDFLSPEFWEKLQDPMMAKWFADGGDYAAAVKEHLGDPANYPVDWTFRKKEKLKKKKICMPDWDRLEGAGSDCLTALLRANRPMLTRYVGRELRLELEVQQRSAVSRVSAALRKNRSAPPPGKRRKS